MISLAIGIDVPDLKAGVRFYTEAFAFQQVAAPVPGVAVLRCGATSVCLLEKPAGSKPAPASEDRRRYERHWTPVHLDIHVDDLASALERALQAGAKAEQRFENAEHGSAAFCSDPFGHGFCLLETKGQKPRKARKRR